jgi:pimeloyl-ACP methyl ester carboxylesterase
MLHRSDIMRRRHARSRPTHRIGNGLQPPIREFVYTFLRWVACLLLWPGVSVASEAVILLHGLARTDDSMAHMAEVLQAEGYAVLNVDYPSREAEIESLAATVIEQALMDDRVMAADKIHFVTHSMGGILVRQFLQTNVIDRLGRVVMLGPPNRGSEGVDQLGDYQLFDAINGPAGKQLGTGTNSVPNRLGPVNFELGVIAGDRSINWINSGMIEGPDDGKVSVASTKVEGMKEHLVLHVTHPYLMKNTQVIRETVCFLRTGRFCASPQESTDTRATGAPP